MKKILFLLLACLSIFAYSETVISDWKGAELGLSENPRWLKAYNKNENVEKIRSAFSIAKDDLIFVGEAEDEDSHAASLKARNKAQLKAAKKLTPDFSKDASAFMVKGLIPVYSFWIEYSELSSDEEIEKSWYKVYEIYSISKNQWELNKAKIH
ncbi:MAG: hypothetical protein K6F15_02960 [Treponema sp.]|nr:hypothetical protein [Treponema sp.]